MSDTIVIDPQLAPAVPAFRSLAASRGVALELVLDAAQRGTLERIINMPVVASDKRTECRTTVYSLVETAATHEPAAPRADAPGRKTPPDLTGARWARPVLPRR